MMNTKRRKSRRLKAEMNVVPYIDVMLVLLVIFMITAPLIQQSVKVDLPEADSSVTSVDKANELVLPIILTVDEKGQYYLNISSSPNIPLSESKIKQDFHDYLALHPDIDIYIQGDANARYNQVMQGFEFLHQSGAKKINFSTKKITQQGN